MADRWRLPAALLVYVLCALGYSLLMPPWEAPDEPAHYLLALNLARIGKFSSLEANYEAHQPQPYYRLASIPLKALYEADPGWVAYTRPEPRYSNIREPRPVFPWSAENYRFLPGLYALRWLNILFGAGAAALNYAAMRRFFPGEEPMTAAAGLLAAFIPQYLHITSTVSNDALAALAGAFLFWLLAQAAARRLKTAEALLAGLLAILLPLATKLSAFAAGIPLLLAAAFRLGGGRRRLAMWFSLAGLAAAALVLFSLLYPEMGAMWQRTLRFRILAVLPGAFAPGAVWTMLVQTARSFWGLVGWLAVGLPDGWILALTGIWAAGGAACLGRLRERGFRLTAPETWAALAALLAVLIVLRNGFLTLSNQGRFLFPALGSLSLVASCGWARLLGARRARMMPWLIGGILLLANAWLIVDGILPVYYQPWIDR